MRARGSGKEAADPGRLPLSQATGTPAPCWCPPCRTQMMPYMNVGTLSPHRAAAPQPAALPAGRRHRTIFTDEQLEALENLFRRPSTQTLAPASSWPGRVHLREERRWR